MWIFPFTQVLCLGWEYCGEAETVDIRVKSEESMAVDSTKCLTL